MVVIAVPHWLPIVLVRSVTYLTESSLANVYVKIHMYNAESINQIQHFVFERKCLFIYLKMYGCHAV